MVFNEIENVKLHAVRTFFKKAEKGFCKLSKEEFFSDMRGKGVKYIILPIGYSNDLMLSDPGAITDVNGYTFYRNYEDVDRKYYVFKSIL